MNELWTIPGWGLAFAMWALALAAGGGIIAITALVAWRGRRKRTEERRLP